MKAAKFSSVDSRSCFSLADIRFGPETLSGSPVSQSQIPLKSLFDSSCSKWLFDSWQSGNLSCRDYPHPSQLTSRGTAWKPLGTSWAPRRPLVSEQVRGPESALVSQMILALPPRNPISRREWKFQGGFDHKHVTLKSIKLISMNLAWHTLWYFVPWLWYRLHI